MAVGAILGVCLAGAAGAAEEAAGRAILDTDSLWRMRLLWETEEVLLKSGKVDHVVLKFKGSRATRWKKSPTAAGFDTEKVAVLREPAETPPDWMKPDFDDSRWAYGQGPLLSGGTRTQRSDAARGVGWKLLLLRGKFHVTDPARAKGLTLSVVYKGGLVVYLNGEEIGRSHMPEGAIGPYSGFQWPTPKVDGDGNWLAAGEWVVAQGELMMCGNGVHWPTRDALPQWFSKELYTFEPSGKTLYGDDKNASR